MSEENLLQLLHVAYHGSKEERTQATLELENAIDSANGHQHLLTLLRAGTDPTAPPGPSLSALILSKNCLLRLADRESIPAAGLLEEVQRTLLRSVLLLAETHRRIIVACLSTIISTWGWNYMPEWMPLVTEDPAHVPVERALAVLKVLYVFVKRFKTLDLEPMAMKIEVCSTLVQALPPYLQHHDFRVRKMVFKVMECVVETALQLNNSQVIPGGALDAWFALMAAFPEQYFQEASTTAGKAYECYVLCVKRIAMITYSVLNDSTRRKKPSPLATHFLRAHAATLLGVWRRWLAFCLQAKDATAHRKSELYAIRYVKLCTLDETLFRQHLRPEALELIERILFPYLCFRVGDEEVFADEEDLSQYAQYMSEEGVGNGEFSQRQAASNAILALISTKKPFHDPSLRQELLGVLSSGLAIEDTAETHPRVFGFLHLLCILRPDLRRDRAVWKEQMAGILMRFVAPRTASHVDFLPLRCKAITVCKGYCQVPMPTEADLGSFVGMIAALVQDVDPRVRLEALDAMASLTARRRAWPYVMPIIVPLMEECIGFLDRVQTTFVPTLILYLVAHCAPELSPVLGKLGHALVQSFLATAFEMEQQETGGDELLMSAVDLSHYERAAFSADALLDAIRTVVISSSDNPSAFQALRPDALRLVRRVLEVPDCFDFLEKALHIFLHVVGLSRPIPADCWELLPKLFATVEAGIGVDFFSDIEAVVDNFVSGAPEAYLSDNALMEATYAVCHKMLLGGVVCSTEGPKAAAQLVEALFHQAKGCSTPGLLDRDLPRWILLLLQALVHPDGPSANEVEVRLWLIAALMDGLYYDAMATLNILLGAQAYPSFFDGLFEFFRACLQAEGGAPVHPAPPSRPATKKKSHKRSAAEEVPGHLSLLTRKVLVLGSTALLQGLVSVAGSTHTLHASFVDAYLEPTLRLINYCLFTNADVYEVRCRAVAAPPPVEDPDEEDGDADEDVLLGIDDGQGEPSDGETWDDEAVADDPTSLAMAMDEGDEYSSPIDEVNEVDFFLQWVASLSGQAHGLQQRAARVLRCEKDYTHARALADRYREVLREMTAANRQEYEARLAHPTG